MQYFNINRLWRLIMTAFCFALFGIGGLLLSLIWFPLLNIALRQRDKRRYIARRSISYCFKFFMNTMRRLGVLDYRIVGGDTLASDKMFSGRESSFTHRLRYACVDNARYRLYC